MAEPYMNLTEYSIHQKVGNSRVSDWKRNGILVFNDDGLVDVAASDVAVESARSFGRGGNARKALDALAAGKTPRRTVGSEELTYANQQVRRVTLQTQKAELELQKELGQVIDAERTRKGIEAAFTKVREAWLGAADRLHARLAAEADPRKCHKLIDDDARRALDDLATELEDLAADAADAE